jgi:hypothetical protein
MLHLRCLIYYYLLFAMISAIVLSLVASYRVSLPLIACLLSIGNAAIALHADILWEDAASRARSPTPPTRINLEQLA